MNVTIKDAAAAGTRAGHRWAPWPSPGSSPGLDSTVLVIALPTLSVKLGATTVQLPWVMDAYLVLLARADAARRGAERPLRP